MKIKTSKSTKLRDFVCIICNKSFKNYLAISDIKSGKGKVCSKKCKNLLLSKLNKRGSYKKCETCNKDFWCSPSQNIKGNRHFKRYCSRSCFNTRPIYHGKSGRKFVSHDGYFIIQVDGNQVREHRYIMTKHIGRKLLSTEIVHHIDENKLNNSIENLKIMTRAEHNRLHFKFS